VGKDEVTKDGYDVTIQTDHYSHFLLTALLLDLLEAEAQLNGDARIVNHSSGLRLNTPDHKLDPKYFEKKEAPDTLGGSDMTFGKGCWLRHHQGKLANTVFTYGLHTKLQSKGSKIRVIAAQPGFCDTNGVASCATEMTFVARMFYNLYVKFNAQNAQDGTMGLLRGMADAEAKSGVMYSPKGDGMSGPAVEAELESFEKDPDVIQMLWEVSEAATGVKLAA